MASSTQPSFNILVLDIPPKTFLGIDLISFNTSPNFHGITNISSGYHCLYTGADANLSIRHGHWLEFSAQSSKPQTFVLKWHHETESLRVLDYSSDASKAAVRALPSLRGRGLVDYSALQDASTDLQAKQTTVKISTMSTTAEAWPNLSRYVTNSVLNRILEPSTSANLGWTLSSISAAPCDTESIPGLSTRESAEVLYDSEASTLNVVSINLKQTWPDDSVGRDRTDKARDRSWYLMHLIDKLSPDPTARKLGARELLGELQFCFLMVLTLANYSCLEQWKRILSVLFTCKVALDEVEEFFIEAVKVLRAQLERVDDVEGGLFEMNDEVGSAWLRALLKTFRANVNDMLDSETRRDGLSTELNSLETWLREHFNWEDDSTLLKRGMVDLEDGDRIEVQMDGLDEEEETGEYAPVVVEM